MLNGSCIHVVILFFFVHITTYQSQVWKTINDKWDCGKGNDHAQACAWSLPLPQSHLSLMVFHTWLWYVVMWTKKNSITTWIHDPFNIFFTYSSSIFQFREFTFTLQMHLSLYFTASIQWWQNKTIRSKTTSTSYYEYCLQCHITGHG